MDNFTAVVPNDHGVYHPDDNPGLQMAKERGAKKRAAGMASRGSNANTQRGCVKLFASRVFVF